MASPFSSLFSGFSRGLVMDELDAWSEEPIEPKLRLIPTQRTDDELDMDVIDLTDVRFDVED